MLIELLSNTFLGIAKAYQKRSRYFLNVSFTFWAGFQVGGFQKEGRLLGPRTLHKTNMRKHVLTDPQGIMGQNKRSGQSDGVKTMVLRDPQRITGQNKGSSQSDGVKTRWC
jgi:hypothetical protein